MAEKYPYQVAISLGLIVLYLVTSWISKRIIIRHAAKTVVSEGRVRLVKKLFDWFWLGVLITLLIITWEISLRGLSVYFASFFAVAGIGLFASWSILSNITASAILFFYFPYKIGSSVRIMDGDNSVEGKVADITLFSIRIVTEDGQDVYYPNNLAIQKPIMQYKNKLPPGSKRKIRKP